MKTILARLNVIARICGLASPAANITPRGKRGSSLVVVLAALGLLLVITVAFLASVSTELQTSKLYSNSSSLKLLTQSAANLVIGQVRVATGNPALCWASQPGMIRTYDTTGSPAGYFKLYTDDTMQGTGKFDHTLAANVVPTTWYQKKGVYVDLNQPVKVNSRNIYPIIDGDSSAYISYTTPLETAAVKTVGTAGTPSVTGYWLKGSTPVDSASPNLAPMPVKWLYVLQDGTYILPDTNTTGGVVTFTGAGTQPTSTNPIIGRIAYWTDDETCKVNINTASEGSFWDMPRSYTMDDYYYAVRQPVANEFQRYPGHPATVSLSAVFPQLTSNAGFPESFFPVTPRTVAGGSKAGTVDTTLDSAVQPMNLRSDRLYSSTDEFLFQSDLASGKRDLNSTVITTGLDADSVKRAKFFITAHSQAPDVNVFNLPRISMWPITLNKSTNVPVMTAFDKLIAYCGTINDHIFYFQRKDALSSTVDLPAVGSSTGLNRNRQLIEYLRTLTSLAVPGFSSSASVTMASKYPAGDRDQILTQMFDYIRCTNLQDATSGATKYTSALETSTNSYFYNGGIGQVVPIVDTTVSISDTLDGKTKNPRGFGRFPTVQQGALMFIGAGDSTVTPALTPVVAAGKQRVTAAFFLQMFDVSQGVAITCPWYQLKVTGLENLQWSAEGSGFQSMGFPSTGVIRPYARNTTALNFTGASTGGVIDFRSTCFMRGSTVSSSGAVVYPFLSGKTGNTGG
ncbi:MAG TPA: Verru_Chthon cassette protein A, partial [Candidatus Methylacidiphilales bacterium]|nr:Verru_Chthon cassette protein A [Candidatus Methylacidiphilales bacterium]